MTKIRIPSLAIVLLVAYASAHAGEQPRSYTVPFDTIKTQHMVVDVKINGNGPFRLIFDTGAPDSLVNNRLAKEAGLFPKEFKKPPFALFGSMGQFKIKTLEAGDLKAENLSVMVVDHPTVAAISDAVGPIDGIVGFTFFARYKMTIDYQKKLMTFVPNDYRPPDTMQAIMKMMLMPKSEREKPKVLAPGALFGFKVDKEKGDDDAGVTVKEVLPDTPAAAAGLKAGDRLLTLDSRWTDTVNDCYLAASFVRPGSTVAATVLRDGKETTLKIKANAGL
jgi:PDZ domain/Aspartyl protease